MSQVPNMKRKLLVSALLAAGGASAGTSHAATFVATSAAELRAHIDTANSNFGTDTIRIPASTTINMVELPGTKFLPLINSDITIEGLDPATSIIDGAGANGHRIFFVKSGAVNIRSLTLQNGLAKGGDGSGGGAGLGGTIFMYGGNVQIENVVFSGSRAIGGSAAGRAGGGMGGNGVSGGGGLFGDGGGSGGGGFYGGGTTISSFDGGGGGGGFAGPGGSTVGGNGANGGPGGTDGLVGFSTELFTGGTGFSGGGGGAFGGNAEGSDRSGGDGGDGGYGGGGGGGGVGGSYSADYVGYFAGGHGGDGGFGGGGGSYGYGAGVSYGGGRGGFGGGGGEGEGGHGGFGGGGSYNVFRPGANGGFGGGGGSGWKSHGLGGFGGGNASESGNGGGAGFGGAIFVRSGSVSIINSRFTNSSATAGDSANPGLAKGGAIFALSQNALNYQNAQGNTQGLPSSLPTISGCDNSFAESFALHTRFEDEDNLDTYGASLSALTTGCVEINISGNSNDIENNDSSPSTVDNTSFGTVLSAGSNEITQQFDIENIGPLYELNLTGDPMVEITGSSATDFTLVEIPSSPIPVKGGSTAFFISFNPSEKGIRTASVNIANNDNDENPFTFSIRGEGLNSPPEVLEEGFISVLEDGISNILSNGAGVLDIVSDADNDALTVNLIIEPRNGSLTLNPDGTFSYTHNGSETIEDNFGFEVCDTSFDCAFGKVNITITPFNDSPIASSDNIVVDEGSTTTTLASGLRSVLENDFDAENSSLTSWVFSGPSHGLLEFNSDGTFDYVHDGSETLEDGFTYVACDSQNSCSFGPVYIEINPVNDAPTPFDDSINVEEGGTAMQLVDGGFSLLENDSDAEGDTLTINTTPLTSPIHGDLILEADGTFTYTQNSAAAAASFDDLKSLEAAAIAPASHIPPAAPEDSFTYEVCDASSACGNARVTITIGAASHAPLPVPTLSTWSTILLSLLASMLGLLGLRRLDGR